MDRTRRRRASLRRQPSEAPKPAFEELEPDFQWDQVDDTHHRLNIHFPGFVRREINVEADNSSKLIKITGSSSRRDGADETTTRTITVDQSYQVPEDAILEEMSMKFQDGYLTIMIPIHREKKKIGDQKDFVEGGDFPKKPAESAAVEKRDELIQEEKIPKSSDDKQPDTMEKKPKIAGETKDDVDTIQSDEREDEPPLEEEIMPKSDDELHELEKHKIAAGESNDDDAMIQREKKSEHMTHDDDDDDDEEGYIRKETPTKSDELVAKGGEEEGLKTAGSRKRKAIWTGLLEKKKRSRKMILVAVVAFSLGFYASHMLRGESNQALILY